MEEWEQHMSDFVPEDISTIVVEPRKEVVSIILFEKAPFKIMTAYILTKIYPQ